MKFKILAIMGTLATVTGAEADTLITPTLWAQQPVYFACNVTNVGDQPRTVATRIINGANGKIILNKTTRLAPRMTMNTTVKGLETPGGPLYCDFTVEGPKNHYRGVAKLWPGPTAPNASDITAIAAE